MGRLKQFGIPILVVMVLALLGTSGYLFKKYSDSQKRVDQLQQDPQAVARQEIRDLVAKVSQLVVLPEGEDPTVATVSDPDKLKDQAFFASAKKGDKILIYTNAKKAFLYNPETNKILNIAPINIGEAAKTPAPTTKK